jgi:nucleolar GTP-binding protein
MSFVTIGKIESHEWYFDYAMRQAKKKSQEMRSELSHLEFDLMVKRLEAAQCDTIKSSLQKHLTLIIKSFPSLDDLTEFYSHLVKLTLEYDDLKKALSGVAWSNRKISEFTAEYVRKINGSWSIKDTSAHKKAFLGRIGSVMKQLGENLKYLEHARVVMYDYPSIKANIFTIAIAGFPNVGKSTILSKITPAKPEIADYAFTTTKLNIGYAMLGHEKAQVIDTPGTLNRVEKMNVVEQQAYLAMRYVADMIVFVFDLTGEYPIRTQEELLDHVKKHNKPIVFYLSKTDILPKNVVDEFIDRYGKNGTIITNTEDLAVVLKKKKRELFKTSGIEQGPRDDRK